MTAKEIIEDINKQMEHIEYDNKEFICSCCLNTKSYLEALKQKLEAFFEKCKESLIGTAEIPDYIENTDAFDILDHQLYIAELAKKLLEKYFPEEDKVNDVLL